MSVECIFCGAACINGCCSRCDKMSRGQKFGRLLQYLERCSESVVYHDEICSAVERIKKIEAIMMPLEFHPYNVFDERIHVVDMIAKQYLEKASVDVQHLIPVDVAADGNCLYHSILLLMNDSVVTTSELRVRTIVELVTNESFYSSMYGHVVGLFDMAIKAVCRNKTFSELYEICALCTVIKCNIRSVYPKIDFRDHMAIMNNIFTPAPPVIASYEIKILWSCVWNEMNVRLVNNNIWSPNHFVPLLFAGVYHESGRNNQQTAIIKTPEKKTVKNNAVAQVRRPDFESSPSRRLRTDTNVSSNHVQSINSDVIEQSPTEEEEKRQMRLSTLRERARSRRNSETNEQRQDRLAKVRERARSRRASQAEEERQYRLDQMKEHARSIRTNETDEEHQIRIEHQRVRSQTNRIRKNLEKHAFGNLDSQRQDTDIHPHENEENIHHADDSVQNEKMTALHKKQIFAAWPTSIPIALKEACLQKFLQGMSMSVLTEVTCAICNVRTPEQKSKKILTSEILQKHQLKVSDELKDLVAKTQLPKLLDNKDSPTSNSSSFYCENGVMLYRNGIFQKHNKNMCILCQKCYGSLSKEKIPKFSAANNMWLGDVPTELQGLTIPEEKLISLHRHNSCVIKLQSPFHSSTTAQGALKGNCITFLHNTPNIVNSLPLKMDDLCDTLKVIFIGARPPQRIQLKRVLTVRKKKVAQALYWLKKNNILYKNIDINMDNIMQLPDDDIPNSIMLTMEQKIDDEQQPNERTGYVPDPLSNPTESIISDCIPISNSAVLDVNGSLVSSDEINKCLLTKIKNDKTDNQMDVENVYLIPHSTKPVNEYFNPQLLAGLYPTLFCYGRGAPEDQSKPISVSFREHIRYLLSYDDRRFEKSHSFIFVVFNILQRRDACFHAKLIATKPYFQSSSHEIQSLKTTDIETALKNISTKTYDMGSNKALGTLLNHIKTIGGRVMGSAHSRTALRTRIHALIFNQGLPSIFLTLNPADVHSPVALYFAGVKLDLDNIRPEQLMNTYKRAEIIASHPVATAKFFHTLISNILDTMIMGGVVGPVKAYFGTIESQGRGSLHLHLLIWLDHNLKPADMKEKIQDASFRENLIAYLEDIIKEDLDKFKDEQVVDKSVSQQQQSLNNSPQLATDNIYAALRTIDITDLQRTADKSSPSTVWSTPVKGQLSPSIPYASPPLLRGSPSIPYVSPSISQRSLSIPYASPPHNESLETPTSDRSISAMDIDISNIQSNLLPACLPTPNPSLLDFPSRFRADVVQLVESGNIHKHSYTCYKYSSKKCRLILPRKLVLKSTIDPETGHISMRRSHPMINNFNEYLISACRSNMDIKFIWTGSDAKALVYYITDYVTKMSLSFHDTFSLIQKSITSFTNTSDQTDTENMIEKSRKLVLRCYNTLASQQELSGVQVASYLMNWDDHYTTHKFQGLFLIQTERYLQTQLNELRVKQNLEINSQDVIDDNDDVLDDENINDENDDEENFQIQSTEDKDNFVLVNTRIDYQYRSDTLNNTSLYDFVSEFYKKKMNETDSKYLSNSSKTIEKHDNRKGRPPNERFPFRKQHPQTKTYLMMKYSEHRVPVLYGPQIPRRDREDTRERYCRAILTLFVPWRSISDLCDVNQNWEDALKSRQHLISAYSWYIIENIQLLHECKKDRDEHLLQVITEAQSENNTIEPELLPPNQTSYDEYDNTSDNEDLLELLGNLNEYSTAGLTSMKRTTENVYIEETIEAVEKVGRFIRTHIPNQFLVNESIDSNNRRMTPFVSSTPDLIRLNNKWQEQLKSERERVRRSLITGNDHKINDALDDESMDDTVVTLINSTNYNTDTFNNYNSILPVASIISTTYCIQKGIVDQYTLNREQRAAFMIITSHLDDEKQSHTGKNKRQLIMCIPGCGGTGKSQLIRAITQYFLVTKRIQMIRKLAPTGIAAAEIGGMTIHSFLGEPRGSAKPRTIKPGDSKLEKEWTLVEYLLIDEMSMVGLTLLGRLNRILSVAKHTNPETPFGGINVIFFGDYLQYRPVFDAPLHTDFSLSTKNNSSNIPTEKANQQRTARSLILQINCVVKLTQQMRTEDPQYLQLLERLRQGQCSYDDYELLLTRVVGQPSVRSLREPPWNSAPMLVFRNEIRIQLNHKSAIHNAAQIGSTPIVCVAQDTCAGKSIEDPVLIKRLLELSDSKTEHLPGLLPLVPGMPVIITQNIAIELGLINGVNGIFRQLVYQADSISTDVLSKTFPTNTQYVHKPLYALIEISKSKIECNLEKLESKIVPIPVMDQTFRVDISDILPQQHQKRKQKQKKNLLTVRRRALPLVPSYSITTHKSQGQTLNKVIIDLKLPNETDDIAAVYVPLSRVKRLADLIILRHFDYKVLLIKPSKSQLNEIERLDKIYIDTQKRFSEWFQ